MLTNKFLCLTFLVLLATTFVYSIEVKHSCATCDILIDEINFQDDTLEADPNDNGKLFFLSSRTLIGIFCFRCRNLRGPMREGKVYLGPRMCGGSREQRSKVYLYSVSILHPSPHPMMFWLSLQWMSGESGSKTKSLLQLQRYVAIRLPSSQTSMRLCGRFVVKIMWNIEMILETLDKQHFRKQRWMLGGTKSHAHQLLWSVQRDRTMPGGNSRRFSPTNAWMAGQYPKVIPAQRIPTTWKLKLWWFSKRLKDNHKEKMAHKWIDAIIWKFCDMDQEPHDR